MARTNTTIYVRTELLSATKALAASSGRREYEIVEDALRAYMRSEEAAQARRELRELLDRVAERSQLSDEEAMEIAVSEVHATDASGVRSTATPDADDEYLIALARRRRRLSRLRRPAPTAARSGAAGAYAAGPA